MELILIIINLCITLLIAFFAAYSKQKGKNQATKEDIGEITDIVKSVESKFDTLSIRFEKIHSHRVEFLIEFYEKLFNFRNELMYNLDMISYEPTKRDELIKKSFEELIKIQRYYYSKNILSEESIDKLMNEYFNKFSKIINLTNRKEKLEIQMSNKIVQNLLNEQQEEIFAELEKLISIIPEIEIEIRKELKKILY